MGSAIHFIVHGENEADCPRAVQGPLRHKQEEGREQEGGARRKDDVCAADNFRTDNLWQYNTAEHDTFPLGHLAYFHLLFNAANCEFNTHCACCGIGSMPDVAASTVRVKHVAFVVHDSNSRQQPVVFSEKVNRRRIGTFPTSLHFTFF